MNAWSRTAGLALVAGLTLGPPGLLPSGGQAPPERLLTDTPEYCSHLLDRLHQAEHEGARPPPEVLLLSDEGQLMCDHGQTRRGILRLRRAMRLLLAPAGR